MTDANLKRRRFDPVSIGLPEEFVLTDYTRLKGCSCKLPQPKLLSLLQSVSANPGQKDVGMDCSIVPLHKKDGSKPLSLVSTTDYFFPSVEDPFLQGEIGAANVLSDLYSMGITECDTMLMLLAASTDMDENERYTTSLEMMKGFTQVAKAAGTTVTGGQTVMNPWPLIGGVAMSVVSEAEMVRPAGLMQAGDVLVLTKPLGNQIAVNLKQWLSRPSPLFLEFVKDKVTEEEVEELYNLASDNMKRLNRTAAQLMKKYRAHGATDVTGFGILGHANNFGAAQAQTETPKQLTLVLEKLTHLQDRCQGISIDEGQVQAVRGLLGRNEWWITGCPWQPSRCRKVRGRNSEVRRSACVDYRKGGGEEGQPTCCPSQRVRNY
ncbi:selenide, water dikinase [Angomonas deanei]|nr:selenide, water dikinase [Angomonas deanei]|eukprot:EPY24817.1 selenide, water dikinase [Angomonas deanei]